MSGPAIAKTAAELARAIGEVRTANGEGRTANGEVRTAKSGSVGFVPTMGYLHDGHGALLQRARDENDIVVASIFVNPTQFGPSEDFSSYPRDLDRDLALLARDRCDVAFVPDSAEIYPGGVKATVAPGDVATPLEGERRPGHFAGVATVVKRLFDLVQPRRAYFGEKDWQQLQVIRAMVRAHAMAVDVVPVPTVREPDGLAMSSRNVRLSAEARVNALCIPRAIAQARAAFAAGESDPVALERVLYLSIGREPAATLDYAVVRDAETLQPVHLATATSRVLVAARVGAVRLIDNAALG